MLIRFRQEALSKFAKQETGKQKNLLTILSVSLAVMGSSTLFAEEVTTGNDEVVVASEKSDIYDNKAKHHEDPTKIVTRAGVGYNGELTFNGTIGLDDTRKIYGSITASGDEWSLGGSWLFEKGIANFLY